MNGPRSPSNITTAHSAYFAPLEEIGSSRPRTGASTKTSRETGRPATSHAAPRNPIFAQHEAETFCPPYPAKPGHLDDDVHPVYRNSLGNDKSIHRCTTEERTNHSDLCRPPPRHQQWPHSKEDDQQKEADNSAISTEGQRLEEPSPPQLPP